MLVPDKIFTTGSSTAVVHTWCYYQHKMKAPQRSLKKCLSVFHNFLALDGNCTSGVQEPLAGNHWCRWNLVSGFKDLESFYDWLNNLSQHRRAVFCVFTSIVPVLLGSNMTETLLDISYDFSWLCWLVWWRRQTAGVEACRAVGAWGAVGNECPNSASRLWLK